MERSTIIRRQLADEQPLGSSRGEPLASDDIRKYPLFANVSKNLLDKNPGSVWLRTYEPGEFICKQGEYGSTAFYIVSGTVRINIDRTQQTKPKAKRGLLKSIFGGKAKPARTAPIPIDASKNLDPKTFDATLGAGDFFGEMTCLSFLPRSANVVATEKVHCLEMLRNILLLIFKNDEQKKWRSEKNKALTAGKQFDAPRPADTPVQKVYRQRALANELRACPLLEKVPAEVLAQLVEKADLISLDPGEAVFREGDVADDLFLVRRGFVKIARQSYDHEVVLNYASKGQYFGEIALLGALNKRTASCSAIDHVDLIAISRSEFEALASQYPDFRAQVEAMIKGRQTAAKPIKPDLDFKQYVDQGLMQGTNMLLFDLERCTRCDECVNACADSHDGLTRLKREGLRFDKYLVPTSCRSCRDPVCLTECPVASIGRSPDGAIIIEDWCIGCRRCAENCPFGNIEMHLFDVPAAPEDLFKQQKPAALASVPFEPPKGLDLTSLPMGMSFGDGQLSFADVPGKMKDEDVLSYSANPRYRAAVTELFRQRDGKGVKAVLSKAAVCDLCESVDQDPNCVYACPHDAAFRVDAGEFFRAQK